MEKKQPVKDKDQAVKGRKKLFKKKPVVIDVIEQALFTSVGLALKTRDEMRKFARDFVEKAELSENEGKKFIDDSLKRYDNAREKFEEKVENAVKAVISLVTRDEFEEIKKEIKKLKKASAK